MLFLRRFCCGKLSEILPSDVPCDDIKMYMDKHTLKHTHKHKHKYKHKYTKHTYLYILLVLTHLLFYITIFQKQQISLNWKHLNVNSSEQEEELFSELQVWWLNSNQQMLPYLFCYGIRIETSVNYRYEIIHQQRNNFVSLLL
jgi:hypothetical protein